VGESGIDVKPGMQTIVCMKWGTMYPAEYVNRLYRGVRRHTIRPTRFVVFTDDARGLDPGIDAQKLPPISLPDSGMRRGPWLKLGLWGPALGDLTGDVLFLDLDVVVTGPIDPFFDHEPGCFCILRNWTQINDGIGNSSVMRFRVGSAPHLMTDFEQDAVAMSFRYVNEQMYVTRESRLPTRFWPRDWCPSFKHTLKPRWPRNLFADVPLPPDARIVVFTGHPRPHEAAAGRWPARWYKRFYKTVRPVAWLAEHWR
jgi:hypothetical protein